MKEAIVLIPGMLCDERLWENQINVLKKSKNVIVPNITTQKSIEAMAEKILKELPVSFSLAGFSLGGIVATEIALKQAERIENLYLIGTNPFPLSDKQKRWWDGLIELVSQKGFEQTITTDLLPFFLHPQSLKDEQLIKDITDMLIDVGEDAFLNQVAAVKEGISSPNLINNISVKTMIISGRDDRVCPLKFQEELHGQIPTSSLNIIENGGHLTPIERAAEVTELLIQ